MPRSLLILLAIGYLCFGGGIKTVQALGLRPAIVDLVAEPGQTITGSFFVKNDEGHPQTYYFSLQTFLPQGEDGDQTFLPITETKGLPEWTYLSQPSVFLTPGQEQRISFTVRVPMAAARGSAQEAIFISTAAPKKEPAGIGIGLRVGMFVFLRVGAVQESHLRFAWVNQPPSWFTHLPVPIQLTLENKGGAYEVPQGTIIARNLFGQERARIPFNPNGLRVLPGARRSFSLVWQDHTVVTKTGFWTEVGEELTNGGIGPYTLSFEAAPGTSLTTRPLFRVFIWPVRSLLLLVGALIVMRGFVFWIRYRLIRRFIKPSV